MALDHDATYKAYPNVKRIDGDKAYDSSGKLVTIAQSKVNTARKTLNTELKAVEYKINRTTNGSTIYDTVGNQLDMIYKDLVAGKLDATGTWAKHIKAVKDANPKP